VGLLSEDALTDASGLTVRRLDSISFEPIVVRLICRRAIGPGDEPELSDAAWDWCIALRGAARERKLLA
jgi:hypothetical protein